MARQGARRVLGEKQMLHMGTAHHLFSCTPVQGGQWHIVLDQTAFFPEGGGQPGVLLWILGWNVAAFCLMGVDKWKAKHGRWRLPVLHGTSACKRLAMFLRWMVRTDGIVDLGIWRTAVHPRQLIIPLDTHVHQISLRLGLTGQKTATLRTAREITDALAKVFPDDPCLGDFALFGYDINQE